MYPAVPPTSAHNESDQSKVTVPAALSPISTSHVSPRASASSTHAASKREGHWLTLRASSHPAASSSTLSTSSTRSPAAR